MAPSTPDEIDEPTLARARVGDPSACRDLVARYQRRVFALLSRVLGARSSLVEDLAQETFLRTFRGLGQFESRGSARLSTWILTISCRLALDELRRRKETEPLGREADLASGPTRPDEAVVRRSVGLAIVRAMEDLGPDARAVFVLREVHGLEYAEIAGALEIDLGTVKSRLSRARAALRASLAEVHDD